jgi:hypothetical protein
MTQRYQKSRRIQMYQSYLLNRKFQMNQNYLLFQMTL